MFVLFSPLMDKKKKKKNWVLGSIERFQINTDKVSYTCKNKQQNLTFNQWQIKLLKICPQH